MAETAASPPASGRRNRRLLVLIGAIFLGSFALAGILRFSGWRPAGMRNRGQMLQPMPDLRHVTLMADGAPYAWNPVARHWRVLVLPPEGCAAQCEVLAKQVDGLRQMYNKESDRVEVLWAGPLPAPLKPSAHVHQVEAGVLREHLPLANPPGPSTYLVDPNGFVVLRYAPGFAPMDLYGDLSRLLRLQ